MHISWRSLRQRRLRTAAARSGYTQACLGLLSDACDGFDAAMRAEHIPATVRRRIVGRVLDGATPESVPAQVIAGPFIVTDAAAHATYITLDRVPAAARTIVLAPWCNIDYDIDGHPIGVELIGIEP